MLFVGTKEFCMCAFESLVARWGEDLPALVSLYYMSYQKKWCLFMNTQLLFWEYVW